MQPAGRLERRLAEPAGQIGDERGGDGQAALDAARLDRDRLERTLAADAAGGRRVEAPLQARAVERGRLDLDGVRRQIRGERRRRRGHALRDAEAEREFLVVARRPHGHGERGPVDPDLERLLDRHLVAQAATAAVADPLDPRERHVRVELGGQLHRRRPSADVSRPGAGRQPVRPAGVDGDLLDAQGPGHAGRAPRPRGFPGRPSWCIPRLLLARS